MKEIDEARMQQDRLDLMEDRDPGATPTAPDVAGNQPSSSAFFRVRTTLPTTSKARGASPVPRDNIWDEAIALDSGSSC